MIAEEEEYIMPESNWGKRAGAFFIDFILIFILTWGIFLVLSSILTDYLFVFLPYPFDNLLFFFVFWIILGIITLLYSGALEGSIGATVGKMIMALEVFSLDTETMTGGKGIKRSLSKIIFFLPLLDIAAGRGKGDPRQRALDISANTIVGDFIPVEIQMPEPRGGAIYVKPLEEKEVKDEFADLPIPRELLTGNCPYCSTPYNIVPSKDKSTWSGLWGSRCIWCNRKVFEQYKRRIQPGKWV